MLTNALLPIAFGAVGMISAFLIYANILKTPSGEGRVKEIADEIHLGAMVFMASEYKRLGIFCLICIAALYASLGVDTAIAFTLGAICSGTAGYIGMYSATKANVRTAVAANTKGAAAALNVAFFGGSIMGLTVASMGLLGIGVLYHFMGGTVHGVESIEGFAMGGSSVALFSRVGGGIFTKSADVGADLVGKVEAGIPEDDPRNPATIADNVGDNVGDVAGMGADLFESYAGSIIAPISLIAFAGAGGLTATGIKTDQTDFVSYLMFPVAIAFLGMVASIIGSFFVKSGDSTDSHALSRALHRGTNIAMGLTIIATVIAAYMIFDVDKPWGIAVSVIGGLIVGWALGKTAEYYTSDAFSPVKKIANQSETGPATTVLSGVSTGMVSVAASVILILVGVLVAWWGGDMSFGDAQIPGGIYGIAVAAIGMLATTGVVVSVDAYGPISDNAGGIAEMAHLDPSVRKVTDALDSLGNTTAAIAKGFAVGSAALTALALFKSFEYAIAAAGGSLDLNIGEVDAFIGLFLGAGLPFLFAALTIDAVGRAANKMIEEVRRQFRDIPGLREGKEGAIPDSARCVAISTEASLKEMIVPGALAVVVPLVSGFISVNALGAMLAGVLVSGFAIAIYMANAGGAWDNAKKYIEAGNHGGKGSEAHKAAVVGDTVGDPFKDTSGPAMNILIKVMTIVALVFASAFV